VREAVAGCGRRVSQAGCRPRIGDWDSFPAGVRRAARLRPSLLPRRLLPEAHGAVVAGGGEERAARAERHTADPVGVTGEGALILTGGRFPAAPGGSPVDGCDTRK
jgi:hypothetical protein